MPSWIYFCACSIRRSRVDKIYMSEIWSSQCAINLNSWRSNLKKIQAWTGLEPMNLRYQCSALSTELPSHMDRWSIVSSWYTLSTV